MAISALISENGFHLPSVDVFKCDEDHSMNGNHFVDWISRTSSLLRQEHGNITFLLISIQSIFSDILGPDANITIVIDNATWHNNLTDDTKPPKRAWNTQKLIEWLDLHKLTYPNRGQTELLNIAFENAPEKKYVMDETAMIYNIRILR